MHLFTHFRSLGIASLDSPWPQQVEPWEKPVSFASEVGRLILLRSVQLLLLLTFWQLVTRSLEGSLVNGIAVCCFFCAGDVFFWLANAEKFGGGGSDVQVKEGII